LPIENGDLGLLFRSLIGQEFSLGRDQRCRRVFRRLEIRQHIAV
jgi:hypothetical protein